jgi:hypothetical protein
MDAIERFGQRLHEAFAKGVQTGKLAGVGGNFAIVVHEKKTWTVITKGPKPGVVEAITDDRMDFIMIVTFDVFEKMYPLDGGTSDLDVDQVIASNRIAMHGDMEIFLRFIALNGAQDMLSLRSSGAGSVKTAAKPARKRTRAV